VVNKHLGRAHCGRALLRAVCAEPKLDHRP
jgi:hypothetical protein